MTFSFSIKAFLLFQGEEDGPYDSQVSEEQPSLEDQTPLDTEQINQLPTEEREAYLTEVKPKPEKKKKKVKVYYNLHDMLFPRGKVAKLCRFRTMNFSKIRLKEILVKFELVKP